MTGAGPVKSINCIQLSTTVLSKEPAMYCGEDMQFADLPSFNPGHNPLAGMPEYHQGDAKADPYMWVEAYLGVDPAAYSDNPAVAELTTSALFDYWCY